MHDVIGWKIIHSFFNDISHTCVNYLATLTSHSTPVAEAQAQAQAQAEPELVPLLHLIPVDPDKANCGVRLGGEDGHFVEVVVACVCIVLHLGL